MALHEAVVTLRKRRADKGRLVVLIVFGDRIGPPIIPPYYTLRLLPYIVPAIHGWKQRMLREKDVTDPAGAG